LLHPTNGVLLVTRLDGPTPSVARGLVDKAMQAERDGLWGRAYFDLRNTSDPAMKPGDDWIRGAAEICRRLGFETVVDENPGTFPPAFPLRQVAFYAGWYSQDVDGPFALPKVEFMPGAFAYHLHSFSASTLRATNRGWAGPLLAKGATATMGCVDEPYLAGTPDMSSFFGRFIYHAFSFGEAAYACQSVLSWQTTAVGDPLYRPFARMPEELRQDLAQRQSNLEEWYYIRLVNLNLALGKSAAEAISVLEGLELTKKSAVLTEKLGDLYAAQGKPSSAVHSYQQALKLDTSPQQRLQLLLLLGEKLTALERQQEAYEQFQTLLRERPDYPDHSTILKKLLALARKLDKKSDAAQYEAQLKNLSALAR
jgi:tetratricopeptide (TPR) repeat protein